MTCYCCGKTIPNDTYRIRLYQGVVKPEYVAAFEYPVCKFCMGDIQKFLSRKRDQDVVKIKPVRKRVLKG